MAIPNQGFIEIFATQVKDKLFASNTFLSKFTNANEYLKGREVNIPNYLNTAGIQIDGVDPDTGAAYNYAFASQSTGVDNSLKFTTKSYRFNPIRIENFDAAITNVNIFETITKNSLNQLNERTGTDILYTLGVNSITANTIATTGGVSGFTSANGPNATTRKRTSYEDVVNIAKKMDLNNEPKENRYLLMHPEMYYDLMKDPQVINALNFGETVLPEGVVKRVAGINILDSRSVVLVTSGSSYTPIQVKSYSGAGIGSLSASSYASLAWQQDAIAFAMSTPQIYTESNNAIVFGSIVSGEILAGASNGRKDGKGLYILAQGL